MPWSFLRTSCEKGLWIQSHKHVRPAGFVGECARQRSPVVGTQEYTETGSWLFEGKWDCLGMGGWIETETNPSRTPFQKRQVALIICPYRDTPALVHIWSDLERLITLTSHASFGARLVMAARNTRLS